MRLVNLQLRINLQYMGRALCQAKSLSGLLLVSLVLAHSGVEAACTAGHPNANLVETTPDSAFLHHVEGTVTHDLTSLMWDRCPLGMTLDDNSTPTDFADDVCSGSPATYNWQAAFQQVVSQNNSSHLGYDDWRLPNLRELMSIVETCGYNPAFNQFVFPSTILFTAGDFWTATSWIGAPTEAALMVRTNLGSASAMIKTGEIYMRLVRLGKPDDAFDLLAPASDQTITGFTATPSSGEVDGNSVLSATASSALAVTFGSSTSAVCIVADSTVTYLTAGTCTVTADQAGDANYNAAPQISLNITVARADQTIIGLVANPATGVADGTSALSATASSGLAVTFGSSTSAVCIVAGSTVTYLTAGTCTVTADQAGDANYNPAPQVALDINVTEAPPAISYEPIPTLSLWGLVALFMMMLAIGGMIVRRRTRG